MIKKLNILTRYLYLLILHTYHYKKIIENKRNEMFMTLKTWEYIFVSGFKVKFLRTKLISSLICVLNGKNTSIYRRKYLSLKEKYKTLNIYYINYILYIIIMCEFSIIYTAYTRL